MKNILIMGIGRTGKTTLSKMLKDKYINYNLIHSDSLKWALIKAANKEKYYRNNIIEQKKFEQSEYFQKTLLYFFNSLISNDKNNYGYILESGQLHPKIVKKMINVETTIIVCLGLGSLSSKDIMNLCIENDTEEDWTYCLPKKQLMEHANDWYFTNEMLKKECSKYDINYYDTSKNRMDCLNSILKDIEKKL